MPPFLVDARHGGCCPGTVVGNEDQLLLIDLVPVPHPAEQLGVIVLAFYPGKAYVGVLQHIPILFPRHLKVLDQLLVQVILGAGDEPGVHAVQLVPPGKVVVPHVEYQNATRGQAHAPGGGNVGHAAPGQVGKGRKAPLVVQQQVQLDSALARPELRPVVQRQRQRYDAGVQQVNLSPYLAQGRLGKPDLRPEMRRQGVVKLFE